LLSAGNDPQIEISVSASWPMGMHSTNSNIPSAIVLYANGREIARHTVAAARTMQHVWNLPRPAHDTYYVVIASAPGVSHPYWATARPYQPTSTHWDPVLIGATNPVWVDANGDRRFTSPRDDAEQLVKQFGHAPRDLLSHLTDYDWATAAQCAEILERQGMDVSEAEFERMMSKVPREIQNGFKSYWMSLPREQN
jgi:hypothetical protein